MNNKNKLILERTCENLKSIDAPVSWSLSGRIPNVTIHDPSLLDSEYREIKALSVLAIRTGYLMGILDREGQEVYFPHCGPERITRFAETVLSQLDSQVYEKRYYALQVQEEIKNAIGVYDKFIPDPDAPFIFEGWNIITEGREIDILSIAGVCRQRADMFLKVSTHAQSPRM